MIRVRAGALVLAAAAALTGCGGTADETDLGDPDAPGAAEPRTESSAAALVCADAATAVPQPTALPGEVPLPSDAVLTGSEERSGGRLVVTAVTPGDFRSTLAFMQRAYPAAGLTLKEGEVEDRDAESNFAGKGLVGRWTLREIPDCDGDTLVTVLVARA
ncbi:hypothetical protein [Micromonospora sp. NPDC050200]|uniref:hypothetical protein n=1 Tax=Micromonospora sp. NPDC050200 TaxID=3155664 RepID=UPI0033D8103E